MQNFWLSRGWGALLIGVLIVGTSSSSVSAAEPIRQVFKNANSLLALEIINENLVRAEYASSAKGLNPGYNSPMVAPTRASSSVVCTPLLTSVVQDNRLETSKLAIQVDPDTLCFELFDKTNGLTRLSRICPQDLQKDWKGLDIDSAGLENIYGLGQELKKFGSADGDWVSHGSRMPGYDHGNGFIGFGKSGVNGNIQMPIAYLLGPGKKNFGLFVDNVYRQEWDFKGSPWKARMFGDQLRFYIFTGENLPALRTTYMNLVGHAPVPPRKAFGMWVSEFGYNTWGEIDILKAGMRDNGFPVDGFVLDLQWFGGFLPWLSSSPMGGLEWNTSTFPDPKRRIQEFLEDNIGLITIEESYIAKSLRSFDQLKAMNGLAFDANKEPIMMRNWFGYSGMVDWTNEEVAAWWHDHKRIPNLVDYGIVGHWTDLGEPEIYDANALYRGVEEGKITQSDVHNLYNFMWNKSIAEGYQRAKSSQRPFILSRSGTAGSQRYGVAMWSGDISSELEVLATHHNVQMHMSLSGIDYFGADVGGFRRQGMPSAKHETELYTQWFANGTWFDIPLRPHTDNYFQLLNHYETAPHLVGRKESNLVNLRRRYEWIPYYYSLAHRAYAFAEPLIPPPVYYYQEDPVLRQVGHQKMIGRDVMVGVVAQHGQFKRSMYLPKGKWINYYTGEWLDSQGEWTKDLPVYVNSNVQLPVFVREGAILPQMFVDEHTMDSFGHRSDGTQRDELIVQVYPGARTSEFTIYEDDGKSISYDEQKNPVFKTRTTLVSQTKSEGGNIVRVAAAQGTFESAVQARDNVVRLVAENAQATKVSVNGRPLRQVHSQDEFDRAEGVWFNAGHNLVIAKSGRLDVSQAKEFSFTTTPVSYPISAHFACRGWLEPGEEIFILGSVPALGSWNIERAQKLNPSAAYEYMDRNSPPVWSTLIEGFSTNASVEWKCVKKTVTGEWVWPPQFNNSFRTVGQGYAGTTEGRF